jgi:PDGLE domain
MKKIIIPLLIASAAAIWASQKPDGLEHVANILGFAGRAQENHAVLFGYSFHFAGWPIVSAILAGLTGVAMIYGFFQIGLVMVKLWKGRTPNENN